MLPLRWFVLTPCALCRQPLDGVWACPEAICTGCREALDLQPQGVRGLDPLPWWGAGTYCGAFRSLLLELRRRPRPEAMAALAWGVRQALKDAESGARAAATGGQARVARPLLVPIPSWKRTANPLPPLFCRALVRHGSCREDALLARSRPVLGQHHLSRRLRFANQQGAFRCLRPPGAGEARRRPVLIVDDILTTGATASSAAATLTAAGWRVAGLVCLARTPAEGVSRAVP